MMDGCESAMQRKGIEEKTTRERRRRTRRKRIDRSSNSMAHSGFSGSLTSPRFDLAVDMGHPFLNRTVDGFLKVGACKVAAEETFECLHRGDVSKHKVERAASTIAGVYVGMEYGIERIRGHRDWKNAMLGGAVTGALVSAASNSHRQNVAKNAITGGAIATAAEFLNYLP